MRKLLVLLSLALLFACSPNTEVIVVDVVSDSTITVDSVLVDSVAVVDSVAIIVE